MKFNYIKTALTWALLFITGFLGYAVVPDTIVLYYRQNSSELDPDYLDNRRQMTILSDCLSASGYAARQTERIEIVVCSSPEGGYEHNLKLSCDRAESAREYVAGLLPDYDNVEIKVVAENWSGLYNEVRANYTRHDRNEVLAILGDDSIGNDTRKWRLQQLDGGYTWDYLIRNGMLLLRSATLICIKASPDSLPLPAVSLPASAFAEYGTSAPNPRTYGHAVPESRKTLAALKTNLLYDAATALNVEAEIPVAKDFSITFEDVFPWWTWGANRNKYAFQMWEMGTEARWWFKKNEVRDHLAGHFIGIYAMSSVYDFQYDRSICYQGEYWSAGLSYGYALPIGENLNMELSASLGYLRSDYRHYKPSSDYTHLFLDPYNTGTLTYFGPTKLKIALVLPIKSHKR